VAELRVELPSVVCVLGSNEACDDVEARDGLTLMRVAPREVMFVGTGDLSGVPSSADPRVWVEDISDAWVALVLEGADAPDAFARVSELELPTEGWIQGEVARAPAKVLIVGDRVTILVPAMLAAHAEERIRADAAEVLGS
jgi:hypothetical protein